MTGDETLQTLITHKVLEMAEGLEENFPGIVDEVLSCKDAPEGLRHISKRISESPNLVAKMAAGAILHIASAVERGDWDAIELTHTRIFGDRSRPS